MINGLRSEFYKLFRARIFWILLLICLVFSLFITGLLFLEEKGILLESITVEPGDNIETGPLQGYYVFINSLIAPDSFFIYLFAVLLSAFFLAGEFSNGTIKNIVSTGYKRYVFYMTKMITIWIGTMIVLTFMTIIFALFTSLLFGIGPIPSSTEWLDALKAFGLTCLFIGGFSAIVTFISINASGSATALFAGIGFYLIFATGIDMLASQYTLFEEITRYSVFSYMSNLPLDLDFANKFIQSAIGVSLGTIIAFTAGGIALFQRKDIN